MNILIMVIYLSSVCANAEVVNNFVVDYFVYHNVRHVLGISCNDIIEDVLLLRSFNEYSIAAALDKLQDLSRLKFLTRILHHKVGIFLDTRCYPRESIIRLYHYANDHRLYDNVHCWLILDNNLTNALDIVNDDAFGMSTDFVVAIANDANGYELYDVYNKFKRLGTKLNVTFYGEWNDKSGLTVSLVQSKPHRRYNFFGLPLKVHFYASAYRPPLWTMKQWFEDRNDTTRDSRIKFCYHIINYVAQLYNFTILFMESEVWAANDTLGTMVRSLMQFKADIGGTSVSINSDRAALVRFIHHGWPLRTCFFFRNPQPKKIKASEIFWPFSRGTWVFTFFFTILIMVTLGIHFIYDGQEKDYNRIFDSYTVTVGAMCLQGTEIEMSRVSTRTVFLSLMIFSLMIFNYYSALVVSAKLSEPIFKINDSLVELAKLKMRLVSENLNFLNFFLVLPLWEHVIFNKDYWQKIPEKDRFMEPEKGMAEVKKGGTAWHSHSHVGYYWAGKMFNNQEICEMNEVHLIKLVVGLFGVTKNSSFEDLMRTGYVKISEIGLRRRQLDIWQTKKPFCDPDQLSANSINIYEFAMHLIILTIGSFCAFVIYFLEYLFFHKKIWNRRFSLKLDKRYSIIEKSL